ncbi:MAG: fasciclin domain-containing protein [Actinobacteria bacterium]|nr:fasciclin domain-containing protein [Actinomycetota bacterium]
MGAAFATAPQASRPAAAKPQNIVQTAQAAGQFKTLATLLKQAGLAQTLSGTGPYTVFAPTDAAFAKVPKATLTALANDKAQLKAVLLYHVVKGRVGSKQVVKLNSAKTLNGQVVRIKVASGSAYVNNAKVTKPDVRASNGVIHVINRVLIPSA